MLDPSCPICHPTVYYIPGVNLMRKFNLFWNWYKPIVYADTYIHNTVNELGNVLLNEMQLNNESNQEDERIKRIRDRSKVIIERLIGSMRYWKQPPLPLVELVEIVLECVFEINNLDRERDQQLIGSVNLENLQRQHEKSILDQKFSRFWSWYITIIPA